METAAVEAMPPTARSKIANGSKLLSGVDGRSREARRLRDTTDLLLAQLPAGPTEADTILVRRAAALTAWCEAQESRMTRGEAIDMPALVTTANALRRILSDLGVSPAGRRHRRAPRSSVARTEAIA